MKIIYTGEKDSRQYKSVIPAVIEKEYPQLDWVRASNKLWIGKLKENNG